MKKGREKVRENDLWQVWLTRLTKMDKKNFISFEEFKKKGKRQETTISTKTAEEIIEEAKGIRELDKAL